MKNGGTVQVAWPAALIRRHTGIGTKDVFKEWSICIAQLLPDKLRGVLQQCYGRGFEEISAALKARIHRLLNDHCSDDGVVPTHQRTENEQATVATSVVSIVSALRDYASLKATYLFGGRPYTERRVFDSITPDVLISGVSHQRFSHNAHQRWLHWDRGVLAFGRSGYGAVRISHCERSHLGSVGRAKGRSDRSRARENLRGSAEIHTEIRGHLGVGALDSGAGRPGSEVRGPGSDLGDRWFRPYCSMDLTGWST